MTIACPLCAAQQSRPHFKERGYTLRSCLRCGLFFIAPYPPTEAAVHRRATDYSFAELEILDPTPRYANERTYWQRHFPAVAAECENATSFLDAGCGTGHLLELLAAYPNLRRTGIEPNAARAAFARRAANCAIHETPLEQFHAAEPFDVIALINVLSHIPNFDSLFAAFDRLLAPGGKLLLKVGEIDTAVQRRDVADWSIPDHLHFLGLNTIDHICAKYNYRKLKHSRVPFSTEFFAADRWRLQGRSSRRNALKRAILAVPFALPTLAAAYRLLRRDHIYSSFIVLTRP